MIHGLRPLCRILLEGLAFNLEGLIGVDWGMKQSGMIWVEYGGQQDDSYIDSFQYSCILSSRPQGRKGIVRMNTETRREELKNLCQLNLQQDFLDVFIRAVLDRVPTIYVIVNLTLCIWLAQLIFYSHTDKVPRSIYLLSPYFGLDPVTKVIVMDSDTCPQQFEKVVLRTFPTLLSHHITHQSLHRWFDKGKIFCLQRMDPQKKLNFTAGECPGTYCNGYCMKSMLDCPITKIEKLHTDEQLNPKETVFYRDKLWKYVYSKSSGKMVVSLKAAFLLHCANDYKFFEEYHTAEDYFETIGKNCGDEGSINSIYRVFDEMDTEKFLYNNMIPVDVEEEDSRLKNVDLGTMHSINFNVKTFPQCEETLKQAKNSKKYLFNNPVEPELTQNLLVIAFVFLITQGSWLIAYSCCSGYYKEKNIMVVLLAIIELIVITFIYNQNIELFQAETFINEIALCIEKDIVAAQSWNFGIGSSRSFVMMQFASIVFLAMFFVAFIIDKCVFGHKSEAPVFVDAENRRAEMEQGL